MEACQSFHLNQLSTNQSSASKYWTHARKYYRDPCRLSFTQRACSQATQVVTHWFPPRRLVPNTGIRTDKIFLCVILLTWSNGHVVLSKKYSLNIRRTVNIAQKWTGYVLKSQLAVSENSHTYWKVVAAPCFTLHEATSIHTVYSLKLNKIIFWHQVVKTLRRCLHDVMRRENIWCSEISQWADVKSYINHHRLETCL
jgi:hypothetical protein